MAKKEITVRYKIALKELSDTDTVSTEVRRFFKKLHDRHGLGKQTISITTRDDNE